MTELLCTLCGSGPCVCLPPVIESVVRSTYQQLPEGLLREDVGYPLLEAITLCGAILSVQALQTQRHTEDPEQLARYQARESLLMQQLAALVPKLSVSDQEALLERYPRLFT